MRNRMGCHPLDGIAVAVCVRSLIPSVSCFCLERFLFWTLNRCFFYISCLLLSKETRASRRILGTHGVSIVMYGRFVVLSTAIIYGYYTFILKVDEEEFGGVGALLQEGMFASFTLFLVCKFTLNPPLIFANLC